MEFTNNKFKEMEVSSIMYFDKEFIELINVNIRLLYPHVKNDFESVYTLFKIKGYIDENQSVTLDMCNKVLDMVNSVYENIMSDLKESKCLIKDGYKIIEEKRKIIKEINDDIDSYLKKFNEVDGWVRIG